MLKIVWTKKKILTFEWKAYIYHLPVSNFCFKLFAIVVSTWDISFVQLAICIAQLHFLAELTITLNQNFFFPLHLTMRDDLRGRYIATNWFLLRRDAITRIFRIICRPRTTCLKNKNLRGTGYLQVQIIRGFFFFFFEIVYFDSRGGFYDLQNYDLRTIKSYL